MTFKKLETGKTTTLLCTDYDKCKTFYGKAKIVCYEIQTYDTTCSTNNDISTIKELYSYETLVAKFQVTRCTETVTHKFTIYNLQSATTLRHVKEFAYQYVPEFRYKEKIKKDELLPFFTTE